ncbi:hypothetical protein RND81_04G247600 [Saponaria officinalis]|uniref:Thioredoxin domain-containing protein n=1 Tax=Saponaria officinalis TaxID=3572 RepID=A0AAW1LPP3_SAPOF
MASSSSSLVVLVVVVVLLATRVSSSSSWDRFSGRWMPFIQHLQGRCPARVVCSHPIQMDGHSFERLLSSLSINMHLAVLFYDHNSPFSTTASSNFHLLASIFPHLPHIALHKSLVMPSLFSRYNIHSLPALFILNKTGQMRYYGHKDLHSMMLFYERTLAHDLVEYHDYDKGSDQMDGQMEFQRWYQLTWSEMLEKEPFLVFAIMFLVVRASLYLYSGIWYRVVGVWNWCKQQLNLGMFEESRHLLGQVVNLIDVKRVWCKLKLCKIRNFENGARSARVWASSLASVSLGETSSARPSSSLES